MIELKEEEVKDILNILSEVPLKYSLDLYGFFSKKLKEHSEKKELVIKESE